MVIVCASDDKFALPLGVTLYSALTNLSAVKSVSLYIIDGGISDTNKCRLNKVLRLPNVEVDITWLRPESAAVAGVNTGAYSQAAYLRLLIPELLPPHIDRVIYLDSDLIVEKNLRPLWEEPFGDHAALAVQDYMIPDVSSGPHDFGLSAMYKMLELPANTPYCNAGVIVMNLNMWREQKIGPQVMDFCRQFQRFDQDGLNAIIGDSWGLLHPKWNVMLTTLMGNPLDEGIACQIQQQAVERYGHRLGMCETRIQEAEEEMLQGPCILHFNTGYKPWQITYRGPGRSRWFHYLDKSGWFEPAPDLTSLMALVWATQENHEPWLKRIYAIGQALETIVPPRDSFILVDEDQFAFEVVQNRPSIPFLEQDGRYWGHPPDDATAIRECERLRISGVHFMVIAWPAFWWLDHYREFASHLRSSYRCVLQNEDVVVFELGA